MTRDSHALAPELQAVLDASPEGMETEATTQLALGSELVSAR